MMVDVGLEVKLPIPMEEWLEVRVAEILSLGIILYPECLSAMIQFLLLLF